jgi:hypothetical protein
MPMVECDQAIARKWAIVFDPPSSPSTILQICAYGCAMPDGDDRKPSDAPKLGEIDPHEMIRKLVAELTGPLGDTRDERLANAASAIQNVLERLPADERDAAIEQLARMLERQ